VSNHHAYDEPKRRLAERKIRCRWCHAPLGADTCNDIYCCPLVTEASTECLWCGDDLVGPGKAFCHPTCSNEYHADVFTDFVARLKRQGRLSCRFF
jgi:hypothetical protein